MMKRNTAAVVALALAATLWYAFGSRGEDDGGATLPLFPSYFMQSSFTDAAFGAIGSVSAQPDARIVLVNHHLLAPRFIARALATVATDDPRTVVLVAPDHFAGGAAPVTSVVARWPTPYGTIEPATDAIVTLASAGIVNPQERPFLREHGITNVTMFIKKTLPNARLVPVIIRSDSPAERIAILARAIIALPEPVLVVGSFDFTHDATDAAAQANDAESLRILNDGDPARAEDIAIDSVPGIRLLMTIARSEGLRYMELDASNSARLLNDLSRTDVTSYLTGYWAQ